MACDWLGVARTTFSPGLAAGLGEELADGLGDEPDEGLGLFFVGLKLELGAGLTDRTGALLLAAGVVVTVGLGVPAELALVVRSDVFSADRAAVAGVDAGGHTCCEQGITALLLTPLLAVSRMTITASAVTRTVGKITAQK